ncbi:TIGR04222 domain-containing membrane protein [Streptomyces sp. NPDC056244]|uniref:TIGR04222 domain-containing membrane protein n=1 Tax=Streptomyces sp. NPDC056244 TaxID=3345762 RepID=UPI0035D9AE74
MTTFLVVVVHLAVAVSSVLLVTAVVRLRGRSAGGPVHDVLEAAFLGGGPGRVVDATIAGMQADGRLAVGGPGIVLVPHPVARNPVEQAVLQEHATAPSGALHALRLAVMRGPAVQQVGDALAARGLLVAPAEARGPRRWGATQGVVCLLALPLCFVLAVFSFVESSGPGFGSPIAFSLLPTLFVGSITGMVCASVTGRRITGAGLRAMRAFVAAHPYGGTASAAHLVAAHGITALPDPVLQQQLRAAARLRPGRDFSPADHAALAVVAWCSGAQPGSGTGCGGAGSGCGANSCGGGGSSGGGGDSGGGSGCGGGSSSSCGGGGGSSCGGGGSS